MEGHLVCLSKLEMDSMMGVGIKTEPTRENLTATQRAQKMDKTKAELMALNLDQWKQKEQQRVPCLD